MHHHSLLQLGGTSLWKATPLCQLSFAFMLVIGDFSGSMITESSCLSASTWADGGSRLSMMSQSLLEMFCEEVAPS